MSAACRGTKKNRKRAAIVWKKWRRMLSKRLKRNNKKRSSEKKSKVKETRRDYTVNSTREYDQEKGNRKKI